LDFLTVKPYLTPKNLCIYAGVLLFLTFVGNAGSAMGMGLMFGALFVSYPFALGEKSNMDALYTTLSLGRRMVVTGRYLFALALDVCVVAAMSVLTMALTLAKGEAAWGAAALETLLAAAAIFAVTVVIQALQLPVYFKLGYARAKLLSLLPFFALMAGFVSVTAIAGKQSAFSSRLSNLWDSLHSGWVLALAALGIILIVLVSYGLSVAFYRKREF